MVKAKESPKAIDYCRPPLAASSFRLLQSAMETEAVALQSGVGAMLGVSDDELESDDDVVMGTGS